MNTPMVNSSGCFPPFYCMGVATWLVGMLLWNKVNGLWEGRHCVIIHFGFGEILAAFLMSIILYTALPIPSVYPILLASLFISYNIKNLKEWQEQNPG